MRDRDSNGVDKVKNANNNINNRDNKKDLTSYRLSHQEVLSYIDKKELPDDYSNLADYCY